MYVRHHPQMRGRWLPTHPVESGIAGGDPCRQLSTELPDTAVLYSVGNCPPLVASTGVQGVILNTNLGTAILLTTDASVREQLVHRLQACLGLALRDIGALHVQAGTARAHT
jgi:hypothetical protein